MLRTVFSIAFLILLFLSGSGITFMLSTHVARMQARSLEPESLSEMIDGETITIDSREFKKLPKESISEKIYEITLNGNRYDIYNTQFNADHTVTLFARHDKQEENIFGNYKENHLPGKGNLRQAPPFYSFHFFQQHVAIVVPETSFLMCDIFNSSFIPPAIKSPVSPPPEHLFA